MFQIFIKKHRGYTLTEILVAITIITILFGIALVALGPAKKQGTEARIKNDLFQLQNLAEGFYLEDRNYERVDCSTPGVAALCDDVLRQKSSLTVVKFGEAYCAYATLDSSTSRSFCVDYSGGAKEVYFPFLSCGSSVGYFCEYRDCPDFNNNGVVDSPGDADCISDCYYAESSLVPLCGSGDCADCLDGSGGTPPDGKQEECLGIYNVNRDTEQVHPIIPGTIRIDDIWAVVQYLGTLCP